MSSQAVSRPIRPDMVTSAVSFLVDPKVQTSTLSQRVQFLESKGLNPEEIDEAMRQSGTSTSSVASAAPGPSRAVHQQQPMYAPQGYQQPYYPQQMAQQQGRDWRDWFIMAVVSGTIGYGVISFAKKYLVPHLKPPNSSILEEDKDALTAKYDEVAEMLSSLDAETKSIKAGVEEQRKAVEEGVREVEEAVKAMREADKGRNEEMQRIKEDVDAMKEQLPKMFNKTKEAQTASLTDLQSELKSLKSLLVSRGSGIGTRPSYGANNNNTNSNGGGASSPSLGGGVGGDTTPGFGGLGGLGRPSIPAWQLASSSPAPASPSATPAAPAETPAPAPAAATSSTAEGSS